MMIARVLIGERESSGGGHWQSSRRRRNAWCRGRMSPLALPVRSPCSGSPDPARLPHLILFISIMSIACASALGLFLPLLESKQ